jgi:mediator of RNA polymerase II transcription subunit 11
MSASPVARIEQLEEIEKDVISILQTAGATLLEIAKDRPAQKTVDNHTQKVMADIKSVEQNLSEQIKYLTQVSTGHPHEGSSYPSQKVLQTAWHRLEHAKSRISELDNHRHRVGADLARNTTASNSAQKPG